MKGRKWKWTPDIKKVVLGGIGFLIGRVWLLDGYSAGIRGINPFGIAFYAAVCSEGINGKWMAAAVLAGMFTASDGLGLLKYAVFFSIVLLLGSVQNKFGIGGAGGAPRGGGEDQDGADASPVKAKFPRLLFIAGLCGILNLLLGAALSILSVNTWEMCVLSALESVAVFALSNVYQWGVRFFLYGEWKKRIGNEELISVLMVVTTALCGVPRQLDTVFSVVGTIGFLMILFMGYRYGAATGTITGAAVGVLSVITGGKPVMVGLYCLLGVGVGLFRKTGRIFSCASFLAVGYAMVYYLQNQGAGAVEIRAMLSSVVLFLALPRSISREVEEDEKEQGESLIDAEDVRTIANYKIGDFAEAFKRLSRSFMDGRVYQEGIPADEIDSIYVELSEKICRGCANCQYCWNRHMQETRENIYAIIYQACDETCAARLTPEFGSRCIRLDTYRERAEERTAIAKMNLGWRNRMAENREVMARQMMEISDALRSFTLELGEPGDISDGGRREIANELKKEGVRVRQLSVKKRHGRLEVAFSGFCRGHGCLTKTELARIVSQGAGTRLCPGRATKNVLSDEEAVMFFQEDTRFKVLTGCARVTKSGENISGDCYSFIELTSGELLMILADGMGSGETAYRDSGDFLEVLEHLLEAGFEKKSALRMLNMLFVMNYEGRSYTTLDLVSVSLYSGICEIIKNGAASTYVKRKNRVDRFGAGALPVGVDPWAESDYAVTKLQEGEMVVMLSDGVLDGFEREGEDIGKILGELTCQNPEELAQQILLHGLAGSTEQAYDDMSVLVAGLWLKNNV